MPISDDQYDIVADRRLATDGMLWQTPALSMTAQAFLLTIALGSGSTAGARVIAAILALVASLASMQLMAKHRYHEEKDSSLLRQYEDANRHRGLQPIHGPPPEDANATWYHRISSYRLWLIMLAFFAGAAALVIIGVFFSWGWLVPQA